VAARFGHVLGWTGNIIGLLLVGFALYIFLFVVLGIGKGQTTTLSIQGIPFPVNAPEGFLTKPLAEQNATIDRLVATKNIAIMYVGIGFLVFLVGRAFRYVLAGRS